MTPGSAAGHDGGPLWGWEPLSFTEVVRLALCAAADQVEPSTDGLVPIRARILAGAGVPWPKAFAMSRYWFGPNGKA